MKTTARHHFYLFTLCIGIFIFARLVQPVAAESSAATAPSPTIAGVWEFTTKATRAQSPALMKSMSQTQKITIKLEDDGSYSLSAAPINFPNSTLKLAKAKPGGRFKLDQDYEVRGGGSSRKFSLSYTGTLDQELTHIKGRFRGYAGSGTFEATRIY